MIQPLRQLHRRAFLVLGVALPILFVSGTASRQSLPKPQALRAEADGLTRVAEKTVEVNGSPVRLSAFRDRKGIVLEIFSPNALNAPDVLVYASATEPKDTISSDATFLGEYAPDKLYRLPTEASRFVVLYSLGHQKVLGTLPLGGGP